MPHLIFHYGEVVDLSVGRMVRREVGRFTVRTWHSHDGRLICTMWTRERGQ